MYFYIYISILFYNVYSSNGENITDNVVKVTDIADTFLVLFDNNNKTDNKRIKDLKEKLSKIDSYVVDREKHAELIRNTSKQNDLNQTNFYEALIGQDHFRLLNHSKHLYLTMKEKMNSDDLLRILSERGEDKIRISARRMLTGDAMLKKERDKDLAETVDKYLGEIAMDYHTFDDDINLTSSLNTYWDPKIEVEERLRHNHQGGRRLYLGERTNIKYYPFIVSVHVMGQFYCGGSLYWRDLIITSAACLQVVYNNRFYRENPKAITVRVGSNHSRIGGEVIDALEVYFHPSYSPKTLDNNIALIRLRRQIHMNYHRAPKLVQISHNDQGIPFTAQVLLLGWGITKNNPNLRTEPLYLQRKFLPIYPATYCKEIYGTQFNPRSMFCAGTVTTGEGACNHDAGGPAILDGKLVGIISYGPTVCGFPDAPTVLSLVGFHADWIETVNESMPGYYRSNGRTTTTTERDIELEFIKLKKQQNIKRNSPDIFAEDYDGTEDKGHRMFRARDSGEMEKKKPPAQQPIQPIASTAYSKVIFYDRTNPPVLLTERHKKQRFVQDTQGYNNKEQQHQDVRNMNENNENHDDDDDDDNNENNSIPKMREDTKKYDSAQYAIQPGKLIKQLQSLAGLSKKSELVRNKLKTYNLEHYNKNNKIRSKKQKIIPLNVQLHTRKSFDEPHQANIFTFTKI